ncbi:MAG: ATP-binding protein [bacterium]
MPNEQANNIVSFYYKVSQSIQNKFLAIFGARLDSFRAIFYDEMKLPDVRGRHLFTAPLRIIIFTATWIVFFVFFPAIWKVAPLIPFLFNLGFLITAFCYYYMMKHNRPSLRFIFLEISADILSQTAIIYLLGVKGWAPFLIYGLYVVTVGILSGYYAALVASTISLVCFETLYILIMAGSISDFSYPATNIGYFDIDYLWPYLNLVFIPLAFIGIVYSVRIANYFTRIKEQILERRNTQLTALNYIGATIRRVLNAPKVIDEVLKAVIQGLGFEVCILALVKESEHKLQFYMPEGNYYTMRLEEIIGYKYNQLVLPQNVDKNSVNMAIKGNRVVVRNNFAEMLMGFQPEIPVHKALRAQKVLGFKKFVITPLVAEQRVMGVIIGASKKAYVEDTVIDTLDHFANQAALAIESAQLIDILEQKNKELIEANKIKSEFLAIMSHELRTPLNAVIGYTEALSDGDLGPVNEDQKRSLQEVYRNGQNLLDLINSLLDLAKLESGKMELCLQSFTLHDLIDDISTSLKPLVAKKGLKLRVHTQEDLPHITADTVKMRQVLLNLVGNSIKFTEKDGDIDIFVEYHEDTHELIQNIFSQEKVADEIKNNPAFLIRIRDTGIGIKADDLPHIFDLFKQADSSFTRRHEGTGLGLALSKELVSLHSGLIAVTSQYNRGTEFRILLPQM